MKEFRPPILLLALGNDLLGDDGAALVAARSLRKDFPQQFVDIVESSEAGLALMEIMAGYERALLLDSVQTGQCPPGSILEFGPEDFRRVIAPSPHYAGIPEVLSMAERLGIAFPDEIRILALEVANPFEFQEALTSVVKEALPRFVEEARSVLNGWKEICPCTNTL